MLTIYIRAASDLSTETGQILTDSGNPWPEVIILQNQKLAVEASGGFVAETFIIRHFEILDRHICGRAAGAFHSYAPKIKRPKVARMHFSLKPDLRPSNIAQPLF
ncbi:hypothetical protein BFX40_28985 [Mesorhizobium sp. SEMIA 3007]|nr:hypothetical protein BFX40_28985 [Mesorhizobium sp. SEMIA 3007]